MLDGVIGSEEAQARLQASEARYRRLFESAQDGILILDAVTRTITDVNPYLMELLGYSREQFVGKELWEIGLLKDAQANTQAFVELLEAGYLRYEDLTIETADGRSLSVEFVSNVYLVENRQVIQCNVRDITERRKVERTLQLYVQRLEWSNRELQEFAYIASHDLQEPLRAIQAFGERLKTKNGEALSAEGAEYLERMQGAAGRMRILIHDLLAYSRVTSKARPFVHVALADVAKAVIVDLAHTLEEVAGVVEVGPLPELKADAAQMRQLLQNIIANALKFHQEDIAPVIRITAQPLPEREISIDDTDAALLFSGAKAPERIQILVEDNGIGFNQKYAERIFAPFQRLHSQRKYQGTGIGLAICRKIVERHHGSITAISQPGQGTTIVITLPQNPPGENYEK